MTNDNSASSGDPALGRGDDSGADRTGVTARRRGLEGRLIADRYRVARVVAAGANTLIADADDVELGRTVTLKLIRPEFAESDEFRQRFRQQMEAVAAISHPHLAAIYDIGEAEVGRRTTVFVVSELLTGGSLRDLFDRGRTLSPSQALSVGLDACRALDFAHRKGFVHSELTPSKLVFDDNRRLRIVDFGLARLLNEEIWTVPSDLPTHVARYASPEQAQGLTIDGHSDVYSLALIMAEAVTGDVPFAGDSTVATLANRVNRLMPMSADLGPLASILERAGRPEAADRWSAAQFGKALMRAAERMTRPDPIPILTPSPLLTDPERLRRPNDPTGGITRPDDPSSAVVASAAPGSDETTGPDEIDSHAGGRIPTVTPPTAPTSASESSDSGDSSGSAEPAEAADDAGVAEPADGTDRPDEADQAELAALVERTPPKPAPDDAVGSGRTGVSAGVSTTGRVPVVANRGAATGATRPGRVPVSELVGKTLTKKERKAAERRIKERAKQNKQARQDQQANQVQPAKPGRPSNTGPDVAPPGRPSPARPQDSRVEPGRARRRILPWLLAAGLVAALGGLGAIAWQLFRQPTHEVPALAGLTLDDGLALVNDFDWDVSTRTTRDDTYVTPGQIVRTVPSALSELTEGSPLTIFVSAGPEFRPVPDLVGQNVDAAQAEITALGLVAAAPTPVYDETAPSGQIIAVRADGQAPGATVLPGATVELDVSQGPAPRAVPDLSGATQEQASRLLGGLDLGSVIGDPVFDNAVPEGRVAAHEPAAGEGAGPGTDVVLHLSLGPDLVAVPDLTGMTVGQMTQALADAGLNLGTVLGPSTGTFVAAGADGEPLDAGDTVARGALVNVVVL